MISWMWLWLTIVAAVAQAQTTTTDPAEARVIHEMFSQWGIAETAATTRGWNLSGDPCTVTAVDDSTNFNDGNFNPGIKCDCSFPNSTCHITALGTIPEGLWTLSNLTILNLAQNYLTEPSASIHYQGQFPPEIGQLTELRLLSFSGNNFSGSLPPEIGNLRRLEQIYIDSAGVSGAIPSTFSNLQNLQTGWASDNEFTGRLPDFIGNWSQLQTLRFEGNSFEGSIPPSFSRLTSMLELRISGLSNGTLDFIRDMKSLSVLMLRNNRFSGSIPNDMGEYVDLTLLILGNNSLTGTLPNAKSRTLRNIDVSYNELSGTLPSWAIDSTLQITIVANNFTLNNSTLNCLQNGFPCGRGSPIYSDFGINCGGPRITSSSQLVYEQDNESLGPSTYYLTPERRWGVSNVGRRDNPLYTVYSQRQFPNTLDSELFQSARLSAGSLRYYGLGLENGNYTVNLLFAEIEIADGPTWQSLGKRVFDIYVQGNRVFENFDIKMAAGGASNTPVTREVIVEVLNNYLEVHLFWAGKGTCCIPTQGTFGPLISAISATPNFNPSVNNNPPSNSKKKNNTGLIVGILVPIAVLSFLTLLALYIIRQRNKRRDTSGNYDEAYKGIDMRPYTFAYGDLKYATNDFNPENKLGEGGFGSVYKGTLADGRAIAVKQLSVASNHGKTQFVAEIATISAVQHRNLVKLYGCCIDGEKRLLVYEYHENKSLDQALFGRNKLSLTWSTRFEICMGIARGLAYLHEESRIRIIHRDVKSSNVLLDSDMNPKISDFGLAKLYDDKKTHMSTRVAGTIGYLAPEYAMLGQLTEKADVFGFGVVALEIISGRSNSDARFEEDKIYLLEWAWNLYEENRETDVVDEELLEFDENEMKRVLRVALLCTQTSLTQRPSMSRVVTMISGDIEASGDIIRPEYLTGFKFNDITNYKSVVTNLVSDGVASTGHSTLSPWTPSDVSVSDFIGEGR
ncbi:hypothetical protein LXL04_039510 [Taraxacum kok-saghyz]